MSQLLPYEQQLQQQWTDIPLPDENVAWADMNRRLNDDDKDRGIFWWRPGCAWWALLLVLVGLGWWMWKSGKASNDHIAAHEKDSTETVDQFKLSSKERTVPAEAMELERDSALRKFRIDSSSGNDHFNHNNQQPVPDTSVSGDAGTPVHNSSVTRPVATSVPVTSRFRPAGAPWRQLAAENGEKGKKTKKNKRPANDKTQDATIGSVPGREPQPKRERASEREHDPKPEPWQTPLPVKQPVTKDITQADTASLVSTTIQGPPTMEQTDMVSVQHNIKGGTKRIDSASAEIREASKKDSVQKKKIFFSTGLAMQQQLPVAGQKATPYSAQGRKGSLADYIPALYIRLHKEDKWFLQAEFRYGAPQYSKEFVYQQVSISDSAVNPRFTTTHAASLKKTFYHQLPLTFNYYVLPNWSVGGGIVWNKFYAALSDQETIERDNFNQRDSVLFKGMVRIKEDTSGSLAKSYFQAVFETQYQWKRLSIGARYAVGLQPYIQFTLPGQSPREETNRSLQVFLRFELWRSGKK